MKLKIVSDGTELGTKVVATKSAVELALLPNAVKILLVDGNTKLQCDESEVLRYQINSTEYTESEAHDSR